jgi:hypothetical protein
MLLRRLRAHSTNPPDEKSQTAQNANEMPTRYRCCLDVQTRLAKFFSAAICWRRLAARADFVAHNTSM